MDNRVGIRDGRDARAALRGELYIGGDADGAAEFGRAQELLAEFNGAPPGAWDERAAPLRRLLRHVGENVMVRPPFYCEYGEVSIEVPASPRTE